MPSALRRRRRSRTVEALPGRRKDVPRLPRTARARDELLTLVDGYRAAKQRLDLIDYGDQVALAAQIARSRPRSARIERDAVLARCCSTNTRTPASRSALLLATLFGDGHPVTAVGDPNQAIYGWRGASVGNLLRFGDALPRRTASPSRRSR